MAKATDVPQFRPGQVDLSARALNAILGGAQLAERRRVDQVQPQRPRQIIIITKAAIDAGDLGNVQITGYDASTGGFEEYGDEFEALNLGPANVPAGVRLPLTMGEASVQSFNYFSGSPGFTGFTSCVWAQPVAQQNCPYNTTTTLAFKEHHDRNNNWNDTTYEFVAPADGVYSAQMTNTYSVDVNYATTIRQIIDADGVQRYTEWAQTAGGAITYPNVSTAIAASLGAGDKIIPKCYIYGSASASVYLQTGSFLTIFGPI